MLKPGRRLTITICVLLVAVMLLVVPGAVGCSRQESTGKLKVAATIFPLADFVKNVAGDKVEIITLLPPGASPHTQELSPKVMKKVSGARLLVANGAGLDFWIVDAVKNAAGSDMVVVDTSSALEGNLISGDEHDEHDEGGVNPHFWLDPVLAQKQVEAIAAGLAMVDPDNKEFYLDNAAGYTAELKSLDEEIRNTTQSFSSREFITFHPAWAYFAMRYELVEAAVIEEAPGKEPSAAYIKEVVDIAKALKVKAIFAEPQFSTKAADAIAADSGAKVLLLDPIGGSGLEGRGSYIALMRYNVAQMAEAMG